MTKHRETVQDVMTADPIVMPASASILAAAQKMRSASIGDVLVLDDDGGKILGIVTDRDMVVRGIAEGLDPRANTLDQICSRTLTTVSPDDSIETAERLMREKAIRRLPVVKRGRPVGIVSIGDLAIEQERDSTLADVSAAPPNA
jgi:CBS domain-containing protein